MKLCCVVNPYTDVFGDVLKCYDCKNTVCATHHFMRRPQRKYRCLGCFRAYVQRHRNKQPMLHSKRGMVLSVERRMP